MEKQNAEVLTQHMPGVLLLGESFSNTHPPSQTNCGLACWELKSAPKHLSTATRDSLGVVSAWQSYSTPWFLSILRTCHCVHRPHWTACTCILSEDGECVCGREEERAL
jgi:hypothetical protein